MRRPTVEVVEFGRIAIQADGADVSPGLNKSLELLAFMANWDHEEVSRDAAARRPLRGATRRDRPRRTSGRRSSSCAA